MPLCPGPRELSSIAWASSRGEDKVTQEAVATPVAESPGLGVHLQWSRVMLPDQGGTRGVCWLPASVSAPPRSTPISARNPKQESPCPAVTVSWGLQQTDVILHLHPHPHPPQTPRRGHSTPHSWGRGNKALSSAIPALRETRSLAPSILQTPPQLLRETPGVKVGQEHVCQVPPAPSTHPGGR